MNIRPIHPFPARMASELALEKLEKLPSTSTVLDPMVGSGTVIRHAVDLGHQAVGFDSDPLAVLISRTWATPVKDEEIESAFSIVLKDAVKLDPNVVVLPWIDHDQETFKFISYWFGKSQVQELRCLAYALWNAKNTSYKAKRHHALDVLRVALSRIIVTKEPCASLARDTSHSRPHKVIKNSNYEVFSGFERSVTHIRKQLTHAKLHGKAKINLGDARNIKLSDNSVDFILTSPPYLNAIDYLRGHRLSLVWLGYKISKLRKIRSNNIGSERGLDNKKLNLKSIISSMGRISRLPRNHRGMVSRYAVDVSLMMQEIARVLKPGRCVTLVVGNSRLKGVFLRNSDAVIAAGEFSGLKMIGHAERELPNSNRYLPVPRHGALSKRMRKEVVITMEAAEVS